MINTETAEPTSNHEEKNSAKKWLKSALQIMLLTVIFGGLSYGFIQVNAAVMQLSLPESLWCGLAMALAVVYYLLQRKPESEAMNSD